MFGEQFKKLRLEQNISLSEAAQNVTTVSTLSRWENGKTDIKLEQLVGLLDNINITLLEFISITLITPHSPFIDELTKAISNKSEFEIKKLYFKWSKIYETTKQEDALFNAAMTASTYLDLTHKNIFSKKLTETLEQIFSDLTYWSHYYILRFGNCMFLLPPKEIFGLSLLIVNNLPEIKKAGYEYFLDTMITLLNAVNVLIISDSEKAAKLLLKLETLSFSRFSMYIQLRLSFLKSLLHYKNTKDNTEVTELLYHIKKMGFSDIYTMFLENYRTIKSQVK